MTDPLGLLAAPTILCASCYGTGRGCGCGGTGTAPRIPGLQMPCKVVHYQLDEPDIAGKYCAEAGCPGYTVLRGAEALVVLIEWLRKHEEAVSFDESGVMILPYGDTFREGYPVAPGGFQEWLPSTADTFAAALCKVLEMEKEVLR